MYLHFNELVQERRNSSVLAMELRLSCTNPSISCHILDSTEDQIHNGATLHVAYPIVNTIPADALAT